MKHENLNRRLAYREFGDPDGKVILLCIPGILETQKSFDALVTYVEQHKGCRLITVDHCGRGNSDWLPNDDTYKMSVYRDDLEKLITHIHASHKRTIRQLYLLGTSMGGILSMDLASKPFLRIKGLILNDVALSISWRGLFKLFGKFESPEASTQIETLSKLKELDPKLLKAIRLPTHIDIDYRFNLRGINFYKSLAKFDGPILLLRAEHSELCTILDQIEFQQVVPNGKAVEISGETHPVSFSPEVLLEVCNFLDLEKITNDLSGDVFDTDYHQLNRYKKFSIA